ncbi:hypothetical protein NHL51_12125 [Leucobacter sp. gxy201]|uniref:hypothetical protein n=1 Tax=Leucobacter sp. gxy201 TaxID=2957200 RepID=UPI003DA1C4DC
MQNLSYRPISAADTAAPLPPGVYRGNPRRTTALMAGSIVMAAASIAVLVMAVLGSVPANLTVLAYGCGIVGTIVFGIAAAVLPLRAFVITGTGITMRVPLPGARPVPFDSVHGVVLYPTVLGQGGGAAVLLLDAHGDAIFRMSAPPFSEAVLHGFVSLVEQASGARVSECRQSVNAMKFSEPIQLPKLV